MLVNQTRSFVCHLDVLEINCITNKSSRKLTLFLFTDKILVASRPCCFDIEQLESKKLKNTAKNTLRFKCRADIKSVELSVGLPGTHTHNIIRSCSYHDSSGNEGWFILSAIKTEEDASTFEPYFYKSPKLFFIKDQQRLLDFQSVYNKTRALRRQFGK